MPRVAPSQVVALIDHFIPAAQQQQPFSLDAGMNAHAVAGLLELIDQLPGELLVLDGEHYAEFIMAVAALRNMHLTWQSADRDIRRVAFGTPPKMRAHPVTIVREALSRCPDELPSPHTTALSFVTDPDLREALRLDTSSVNHALVNGEWKAATVLAGSVIEALLLWALHEPARASSVDTSSAGTKMFNRAKRYGSAATTPSGALEEGTLAEYLDIADEIGGVVEKRTREQADIARDFRNLIHPGRAKRAGQLCDRGTALAAVGALEHVVRDLTAV